jgi:voltage-gated sodium channel
MMDAEERKHRTSSILNEDRRASEQLAELANNKEDHERELQEQLQMKMGISAKALGFDDVIGRLRERTDPWGRARWKAHTILQNHRFDMSVGVVIVANTVSVGAEIQWTIEGKDTSVFTDLEYLFFVVYFTELCFRVFAYRFACFKSPWVQLDLFLVILAGFGLFVEPQLAKMEFNNPVLERALGAAQLLKVFRFIRLLRAIRLLSAFRQLWQLVRGLASSLGLMMHALLLMILIMYIFACLGLELLQKDRDLYDDEAKVKIDKHFSSLATVMLTLMQFVSFDSSSQIYFPIIQSRPWSALYFVSFFLMVSIALMNLVTAIIVEGSFATTREDEEVHQLYRERLLKQFLPRLWQCFKELDADGSGSLSLDEVMSAPEHVRDELKKMISADDLEELFRILDMDGGGEIGIDEFFEGISKLCTKQIDMNTLRLQKKLEMIYLKLEDELEQIRAALPDG